MATRSDEALLSRSLRLLRASQNIDPVLLEPTFLAAVLRQTSTASHPEDVPSPPATPESAALDPADVPAPVELDQVQQSPQPRSGAADASPSSRMDKSTPKSGETDVPVVLPKLLKREHGRWVTMHDATVTQLQSHPTIRPPGPPPPLRRPRHV